MSSESTHPAPFVDTSTLGRPRHWSVGAVIQNPDDGRYLMIERAKPPYGLAGVAGHVDEEEEHDLERVIIRETYEETGVMPLVQPKIRSLWGVEVPWNSCLTVGVHLWHLFHVTLRPNRELKFPPDEVKSGGWYSPEQLAEANLEPVWREWLERLEIIPRKPRVTICGSMAFAKEMEAAAEHLRREHGCLVVVPSLVGESRDGSRISLTEQIAQAGGWNAPLDHPVWEAKRAAIHEHLRWVSWCDTVLVWNPEKKSLPGYVGANTMIEMVFGAGWYSKQVALMNSLSPGIPGLDEVMACSPKVLDGDLSRLLDA